MAPIFSDQGEATITLLGPEIRKEELRVTVVPADENAEGALELLFPPVIDSRSDTRTVVWWPKLVAQSSEPTFSVEVRSQSELLAEKMRIAKHQDWRDIVALIFAQYELRREVRKYNEELERKQYVRSLVTDAGVRQKFATVVSMQTTSKYAEALQRQIKDEMAATSIGGVE